MTNTTKDTNEGWHCQECGKRFLTVKAAEKASFNGCPKCGGVDIDLGPPRLVESKAVES